MLTRPYVSRGDVGAIEEVSPASSWVTPLVEYISKGIFPKDRDEAKKLKSLASKYTMLGDIPYK